MSRLKELLAVAFALFVCFPAPSNAQKLDGYISVMLDYLPNTRDTTELRGRLFAERKIEITEHILLNLSGFVDGLIADRAGSESDAILRPQDLYVDFSGSRAELRLGYTRVVWGRLDEIQPTDVINPLDLSRFFFEGRSEARLPVWLARARFFLPKDTILEGVLVPRFRKGLFDRLEERTSPFNLIPSSLCPPGPDTCIPIRIGSNEPRLTLENVQGGARLSTTMGRVDWAVSIYRGLEPFALYRTLETAPIDDPLPSITHEVRPSYSMSTDPSVVVSPLARESALEIQQIFPSFTMVGFDFETARGAWEWRGEVAGHVRRQFSAASGALLGPTSSDFDELNGLSAGTPSLTASGVRSMAISGHAIEGGIGLSRKTGGYRWSGNLLIDHRAGERDVARDFSRAQSGFSDTEVSLVVAGERSFARETRIVRLFGVYNPDSGSAFLRGITALSFRDNFWMETSIGWFVGSANDAISRFAERDFVYVRLKAHF